MADLMRAITIPSDRPDGGLLVRRDGHRDVRPGAHHQGPLVVHRRQRRGDRRGHHRHRADAQLPDAVPARQEPASLRICALLDKPARRLVDIAIDYRGFTIPDQFVVGYGLDYGEFYRNLPFIGVLRPRGLRARVKPRGIGRGRLVIAAGALLIAIGCFLPWWSVGGTVTELHSGKLSTRSLACSSSPRPWPCGGDGHALRVA